MLELKTCTKCLCEISIESFYKQKQWDENHTKVWNYYDSYCKECRLEYSKSRRSNKKKLCVEYMGGRCQDCGLIDIPDVYDFHHKNPKEKDFAIADKTGSSFEKLKPELDKCIMLCANCHRKRHAD